ncbi:MAG: YnbE family lipoprotein [Cypionkella sp.]
MTPRVDAAGRRWRGAAVLPLAGLMLGTLAGCVQVTAPDKPIVIELNVNIRQEVIYRLAADAESTIEENEDIF